MIIGMIIIIVRLLALPKVVPTFARIGLTVALVGPTRARVLIARIRPLLMLLRMTAALKSIVTALVPRGGRFSLCMANLVYLSLLTLLGLSFLEPKIGILNLLLVHLLSLSMLIDLLEALVVPRDNLASDPGVVKAPLE